MRPIKDPAFVLLGVAVFAFAVALTPLVPDAVSLLVALLAVARCAPPRARVLIFALGLCALVASQGKGKRGRDALAGEAALAAAARKRGSELWITSPCAQRRQV